MSVRTRLAWHFLLQTLALVAAVIVFAVSATLLYLNRTPTNGLTVARAADRLLSGAPAATALAGDRVRVAAPTLAAVRRQGGWLQVLDRTGRVIYAYRAPAGLPGHYTPGELVYARLDPEQFGYAVYTWFATVHGQSLTWVFGAPRAALTSGGRSRWFYLGLVGGIALLVAGAGLVFGWRLGTPLLHMLAWLEGMAEGRYDEPPRRKPGPATGQVYAPVLATLRRTAEALREAERQRERLATARDEWIAGVSHDLRTPLSSVKGYADLLAAPDHAWSEADVRRFGAEIARRVDHTAALIDQMNLALRLRSGGVQLDRREHDLVEVARRAVIDLVNSPLAAGREIAFEAGPDRLPHPVDALWFTRAVQNLVTNALVHNPPGTHVRVDVRRLGGDVVIAIADDGVGMAPATADRLFDRYARGAEASAGTGLGGAIARELVRAHGGDVKVHSSPGRGTTVEIRLPPA